MEVSPLEIAHASADIAEIDCPIPDFDEIEKEQRAQKAEILGRLVDIVAKEKRRTDAGILVTLGELADIIKRDRSNILKWLKANNYPYNYARLPDRRGYIQKQRIFTPKEAENIIRHYFGTEGKLK